MKRTVKILSSLILCTALAHVGPASAETVTTKTAVSQKELPNKRKVNFSAFDLNEDGSYSMKEVGDKLFYIFDVDGNEVIDNKEFNRKQMMTVIPMEKKTFTFVDYDDDGHADKADYDYEVFFQKSGLMKFDDNMDGLSASEFIDKSMPELDTDKSTVIEIGEWKSAYEASTRAFHDQKNYN